MRAAHACCDAAPPLLVSHLLQLQQRPFLGGASWRRRGGGRRRNCIAAAVVCCRHCLHRPATLKQPQHAPTSGHERKAAGQLLLILLQTQPAG